MRLFSHVSVAQGDFAVNLHRIVSLGESAAHVRVCRCARIKYVYAFFFLFFKYILKDWGQGFRLGRMIIMF